MLWLSGFLDATNILDAYLEGRNEDGGIMFLHNTVTHL